MHDYTSELVIGGIGEDVKRKTVVGIGKHGPFGNFGFDGGKGLLTGGCPKEAFVFCGCKLSEGSEDCGAVSLHVFVKL